MSKTNRAKSLVTKAVHAEQQVVRVQRRIWLAQLLGWPLLILAGLSGAVWLASTLRRDKPDIQLP